MKKHPIIFIVSLLLLLIVLGEIIHTILDRMAEKQNSNNTDISNDNTDTSTDDNNTSPSPGTSISNPTSISNVVKTQVTGKYTVAQLQAMVPDSISGIINELSTSQWNNIAAAANQLSSDKFATLQNQLDNIGTIDAFAINRMPIDILYNAIISRLQNA